GDPRDLGLGHAGIVLEFECSQRPTLVAAEPGEGNHRADIPPPAAHRRYLGADVEILALNAYDGLDRHSASGHRRKQADLACAGDAFLVAGVLLVDGDPD